MKMMKKRYTMTKDTCGDLTLAPAAPLSPLAPSRPE